VRLLDPVRRAVRWHRRGLAALLLAVAVLAGLNVLTARSAGGRPVLVAARTIPAGSTIGASDLEVAALPEDVVAEGALTGPDEAVGRTAVVGIPARQVLTPSALLGTEGQVGPGRVALPVTFGVAATVALLRVGSRLDVLGADAAGSGYGVVAAGVRVVAIPTVGESGVLGGSQTALVLLEVTSSQAAAITAAATVSALSFSLY
jgi:Flp pilus assembly protein CpaB